MCTLGLRLFFGVLPFLIGGAIIMLFLLILPRPNIPLYALFQVTPITPGGPRVWMGLIRSCAQRNDGFTDCTKRGIPARYDFSVLSPVHTEALEVASTAIGVSVFIGLGLSILFFLSIFLLVFDAWSENPHCYKKNPRMRMVILWLGFLGPALPSMSLALLSMLFTKLIWVFNNSQDDAKFIADFGKAWILLFIAYSSIAGSAIATAIVFYNTRIKKTPPPSSSPDPLPSSPTLGKADWNSTATTLNDLPPYTSKPGG